MSHVSLRMRERPQPIPCEASAMHDCTIADGEDFCSAFPDPEKCPAYRRMLIREGEIQRAGWEFNRFESEKFGAFWERILQEWAENEKKQLYYDPDPRGCEFCDDLYNCEDCPQRAEQENACDYTGDECIDSACRRDGCIGCEVIAPPPKEELVEVL